MFSVYNIRCNANRGRGVNLLKMNKDKERTLYFLWGQEVAKDKGVYLHVIGLGGDEPKFNVCGVPHIKRMESWTHDLPFFHHCPFRISCYSSKINKFILLLLNFKVLHYPSSSPKKKKNKLQHLMLSVK